MESGGYGDDDCSDDACSDDACSDDPNGEELGLYGPIAASTAAKQAVSAGNLKMEAQPVR